MYRMNYTRSDSYSIAATLAVARTRQKYRLVNWFADLLVTAQFCLLLCGWGAVLGTQYVDHKVLGMLFSSLTRRI